MQEMEAKSDQENEMKAVTIDAGPNHPLPVGNKENGEAAVLMQNEKQSATTEALAQTGDAARNRIPSVAQDYEESVGNGRETDGNLPGSSSQAFGIDAVLACRPSGYHQAHAQASSTTTAYLAGNKALDSDSDDGDISGSGDEYDGMSYWAHSFQVQILNRNP